MIRISILIATLAGLLLCATAAHAQYNITFAGQLDFQELRNSNLSNLWGYTDDLGNEYAVIGVNGTGDGNPGGVSIVDITDPTDPQEVFFVAGPPSIWREVKVWNDHAYITTEADNGGLTIIDMSPLPQSTDLPTTVWFAEDWTTSHSLFIDENGRLYIFGSSRGNGGCIMYDLTQDPMAPVEVGMFDNWYVHDGYARGDTLYAAHVYDGFFTIVDVSDPTAPVLLGNQTTPNLFTHNVWLDDSGDHLFTTDERTDAYVGSYNVSDPSDIVFEDQLQSDAGSGAVPHNTYWLNHFLVTSYYTYGVVIYDALRPDNLVEVGHFDTSPLTGDGFDGAWGVYPFFGSQRLIISDIQEGLFVLDPTYVRACWLEGTITNANTTAPVSQATVTIVGPDVVDVSILNGTYGTGYHEAGTYTVTYWAPGFETLTVTGVELVNGEVTLLDVELVPLTTFSLQGSVVDAVTGDPIEGAQVQIRNELYFFTASTDGNGTFAIPALFEDEYEVLAGQWGWQTHCPAAQLIAQGGEALTIALIPGYYDDFELDFTWTVLSTANSGMWERDVPVGTFFQNQPSNPGTDVAGDCGGQAYVTGNGGGGAGNDDIDDGYTRLTSPAFDVTAMLDPHVTYYRWFFNAGGAGQPNDALTISLTNGIITEVVETIPGAANSNSWQYADIRILDHMPLTANMRLVVNAVDDEPGHLVEAGFDLFRVEEMGPIGIHENTDGSGISIRPNPSNGQFELRDARGADAWVELHDAMGRIVMQPRRMQQGNLVLSLDLAPGTYFLRTTRDQNVPVVERIIIQ